LGYQNPFCLFLLVFINENEASAIEST
jgi:hypothetical protein